ncbi:unnamed protein product [Hymenolepis diminuta]|uniref:Uncharacterized protein n=1 Tax=Hymenolepis diminuta TaxID=6216 RepID=A0A564Y5C6_HYMDI|nr:unnamed protein product [Hymenolepis diminuta]
MVRVTKILLCGSSGVGKTSLVYSLDALSKNLPDLHKYLPTYEDTYNFYISIDKNNQEKVRIYEIGGQNSSVGRHFVNSADAVILVYDLTDFESFATLQNLKADIDSMKDRREIPTVIIGNKSDQPRNNKFETFLPSVWSQREKIAYYEMNTIDKRIFSQVLSELVLRVIQPQSKSFAFGKRETR